MDSNSTAPAQQRHESPELGAAIARMTRALVVRASEGDLEALEQLAALERLVPEATQLAGTFAYAWGYSYGELASWLGISKQAAVKRFQPAMGGHELMHWFTKRVSSGHVMRERVARLAARRSA
jgi:hypothetical protein